MTTDVSVKLGSMIPPQAVGGEVARPVVTTKSDMYAAAERRMRRGKRLVMGGFVITIVGIIGYCLTCFSAGMNQDVGSTLMSSPNLLIVPTLSLMGLGTLCWLVGSFMYLSGGMDSDPKSPDLYF